MKLAVIAIVSPVALAPTAALADALSTALAVMTEEEARVLAARYPDVRFL